MKKSKAVSASVKHDTALFPFKTNSYMKRLYLLTLLTTVTVLALYAKPDFSKADRFQIACILYSQGCIVEGAFDNQPTPLYHHQQTVVANAAYWVINEESNGLYSIRNAASGKYVTYDGVRQDSPELRRYITMTDEMDGRNSLWSFHSEGNNSYTIHNAAQTSHVWDVRTDSYCVGTYSDTTPNNNRLFYIRDKEGNLVEEETAEPIDPVETGGYDVSSWLKANSTSLDGWNADGPWTVNTGAGGPHYNGNSGANLVAPFIENWHASQNGPLDNCSLTQTLRNMPAGQYYLEADMMAVRQAYSYWWERQEDEPAYGVELFANDNVVPASTNNDPPEHFVLPFKLDAKGNITLGVRVTDTNANWVAIDNIELRYDATWEELIAAEKEKVREDLAKAYSQAEIEAMIAACGDDFDALEALRAKVALLPDVDPLGNYLANITIDGYSLSYIESLDLYLCSVPLELFGKSLTAVVDFTPNEGCKLSIANKATNPGDTYTFTNVTGDKTFVFKATDAQGNAVSKNVGFTSLPVVRLYGSFSNEYSEGLVAVNEENKMLPELMNMKAKWRGGITNSGGKHKRNYHIKLKDDQGEKLEKSFFKLRNDNSWILESCQVDMLRIRNRIITDLWNDFCNKPYYIKQEKKAMSGTRGRFVELVLNDEYRGIYCMTENMDRKQLKLKKIDEATQTVHGQLWKSKDWSYATMMGYRPDGGYQPKDYLSVPNSGSEMWDSYQVKYPDFEDYGYQTDWETLYNCVDFVSHATDDEFRQHVGEYLDLPVVIDYYILMETILATDNHGKNMFFANYDKQVDKKITFAVWDMDATCGQRWSDDYYHQAFLGPEQDYSQFIVRYEHGDYNVFKRLRDTDADDFNMQVRLRYRDLRQNQLATESILDRFRKQVDEFKTCGAAQREYDKWSYDSDVAGHELDFDVEMEYLDDWFTRRMNYLDQVRFKIDELPSDITDINSIEFAKANGNIYDLRGKKVGNADDYDRLPAGIYIINGKKSVKK